MSFFFDRCEIFLQNLEESFFKLSAISEIYFALQNLILELTLFRNCLYSFQASGVFILIALQPHVLALLVSLPVWNSKVGSPF